MDQFYRFPHTPHLVWLGKGKPRSDKILSANEASSFLASNLVVEEKIDGANLGLSTDEDGKLLAQNRGSWLEERSCHPQFLNLWPWLSSRMDTLIDALWPDLIVFGEWCSTVHSVEYDSLPDWFLGFDVFDKGEGMFWSTQRRDALLEKLGLCPVPNLGRGRFSLEAVKNLLTTSHVGTSPMEGVYLRIESEDWLEHRAKIVRPSFTQSIDAHWSSKPLRRNRLSPSTWK